jgi:Arylsulfotransferase (ASST)
VGPPGPPTLERSRRARLSRVRGRAAALAIGAVLGLAGAGLAAWLLLAAGADEEPQPTAADVLQFQSRPRLDPDRLRVASPARGTAPGYVFVAVKRGPGQDGPMMVDEEGRVVWFRPVATGDTATGFRVQDYRGEPVLTWWEGRTRWGHGMGEYVILDRHYREVARVRAGDGYEGDHHELQLTPRGTAYISIYAERRADLTSVGLGPDGRVYDSVIQEIDVATGRVVWEWHSVDHFPVSEGVTPPKADKPHDYFHVNAVDEDRDGNLLVSARNMHAIYKIDKRTGEPIWRLGGERSDFAMGPGADFHFQHDVVRLADGTISLFDNQATPPTADRSRGLVLRLDERRRTATVVREYIHPDGLLAGAEGNLQTLPNANVFVSWGPQEHVSEFRRDGRLALDLQLPPGADTYQAFRHVWRGEPLDRPAVAARRGAADADRLTVWASWNGATAVRSWQLLAGDGDGPGDLAPIATVPWDGFETAIRVRSDAPRVAVRALDADGAPLGASRVVEPVGG